MAELPALGSHCSWAECGRLDFLPLLCHACGALYCRHHVAPDQHQCSAAAAPSPTVSSSSALAATAPSVSQQHQATRLTSGGSGQRCHVAECGSPLVAAATALATQCDQCCRPVCLAHRHADQHGCVAAVPPVGSIRANLSPQQQQQQLPSPPQQQLVIRPVSELSPLAARVQLMRAKKHARCAAATARGRHQPVPASEDRLYLFVAPPSGSGGAGEDSIATASYCPVFVGRQWSLGRVLDGIAAVCGVTNNNNNNNNTSSSSGGGGGGGVGGSGELRLVRARDQCRLDSVASFSVSVAKLCQDGWLSDGEFVQLQLC